VNALISVPLPEKRTMTTTTTATTPSYFIASGAENSFHEDSAALIRRANRLARNHRIGSGRGERAPIRVAIADTRLYSQSFY
jgi:hypothetical protein